MLADEEDQNERLDHLGRVAGTCRERGLGEWRDQQAGERKNLVRLGTATMAMVLNERGLSNSQVSLRPPCVAKKPVEHLRGEGITAEMVHDDGVDARWMGWPSMVQRRFVQESPSRLASVFR